MERAPFPGSPRDLSPQMRQRYGIPERPWVSRLVIGAVLIAYAAVVVWVAVALESTPVEGRLLIWSQPAPDRVDITYEVRRAADTDVVCRLRAQDADRIDVGYVDVSLPAGTDYVQQTYQMRVLGPALVAEVLDCQPAGDQIRAPGPQFPPGVAPPEQPWQPQ